MPPALATRPTLSLRSRRAAAQQRPAASAAFPSPHAAAQPICALSHTLPRCARPAPLLQRLAAARAPALGAGRATPGEEGAADAAPVHSVDSAVPADRAARRGALTPLLGALVGAVAVSLFRVLPASAAAASTAASSAAAAGSPLTLLLQLAALGLSLWLGFRARAYVRSHTAAAVAKFKAQWKGALFIPVCAAVVGWVTNWIAVQMIFYPIGYLGLPIKQAVLGTIYGCEVLSPLGWGWQGIVPAKAAQLALNIVTMVTERLLDVQQVFLRLDPTAVARLLEPALPQLALELGQEALQGAPGGSWAVGFAEAGVRAGKLPGSLVGMYGELAERYLAGLVVALQQQVHRVVDLKELVVKGMVADRLLIVNMFQTIGRAELSFLVDSGLFFGFLLGLIQMVIWMFYDSPWTLTAGGAVVGYITNWLALKCIFEPVEPTRVGPFVLQGMFLQRQREISAEFADFFVDRVLTSRQMFHNMLTGLKRPEFRALLREHTCDRFAPSVAAQLGAGGALPGALLAAGAEGAETQAGLALACAAACERLADKLEPHLEALHPYVDATLDLRSTIKAKLELMSPAEFERVLHPIFEEDEMTLILAGAVLGAIAGYIQQITSAAPPPPPAADATEASA